MLVLFRNSIFIVTDRRNDKIVKSKILKYESKFEIAKKVVGTRMNANSCFSKQGTKSGGVLIFKNVNIYDL